MGIPLKEKNQTVMAAFPTTKTERNERRWNKNEDTVSDCAGNSSKPFSFGIFDLAVLILSVLSIIIDLCTDLVLVFQYGSQGYKAWAVGTFVLIFFPSLIVQFFSLRWHIVENTASVWHWVLHFFMLGIVQRYVQIIRTALAAYKSRNSSDVEKVLLDQNDLCMLHLFESFLESAPQLVLQMYVIIMLHEWRFWTGISVVASLLSLAWALAAYTKAQRRARANKNSTTWPGLLLQAIWRSGMLTSRITTLVLGAYCFGNYFFLLIMLHWVAMTAWIILQKTDFCETYWEERIYNAVVGVIYCFCFFNLQEGQSRWRALAFYLVIMFQNLTCLTVFLMCFGDKTPKLAVSSFIAIVGGTILGMASMLFYYRFFHPTGPIKFIISHTHAIDPPSYSTMTLRSLKRLRCESQIDRNSAKDSKNGLNGTTLSDSVVVVEENVLDDSDADIKVLKNWINDKPTEEKPECREKSEAEGDAYKRRPICSSADLEKLIESESGSLKAGPDEGSSEILSAHDYENLCAVNIAREAWGLRSWRGYSDIETWLHDDSTFQGRRLDTLTSTTSSDRSANTIQKENERTRQDDYMDAIAEDLAQCESEAGSDDIQFSIESLPVVYPLGTLDPIFEEIEDFLEGKTRNPSASTLVATIDEIRRNTPIQNRYSPSHYSFSPLSSVKLKQHRNWKKVTFAKKLLFFPDDQPENAVPKCGKTEHKKTEGITLNDTIKQNLSPVPEQDKNADDTNNKENIPTVASKINYWNKIINSQNEKNKMAPKNRPEKSPVLLRVLTPSNFPTFQRKRKAQLGLRNQNT